MGTLARTTGLLRSFESVGTTFSLVTSATKWKYLNTLILGFAFFLAQIPFTTCAAWLVPDQPFKENEDAETAKGSTSVDERAGSASSPHDSDASASTVFGEKRLKDQIESYSPPTNPLV